MFSFLNFITGVATKNCKWVFLRGNLTYLCLFLLKWTQMVVKINYIKLIQSVRSFDFRNLKITLIWYVKGIFMSSAVTVYVITLFLIFYWYNRWSRSKTHIFSSCNVSLMHVSYKLITSRASPNTLKPDPQFTISREAFFFIITIYLFHGLIT